MPTKLLSLTNSAIVWLTAIAAAGLALFAFAYSWHQPIEMDLAMMHYSAFLINEKNFLLYRDIFENNLPGAFFFHALIGKIFGYGPHTIRLLDLCILLGISALSWKILSPISKASAILAPAVFTCLYLSGGVVSAFQRDYIATLPLAAALALIYQPQTSIRRDAAIIGALCGLACGFKPNFIILFPAFIWLHILKSPGNFSHALINILIPAGIAFFAFFSIPFIWSIRHADMKEFIEIYKTYTPIYVSTRTDLYHFDSLEQQLTALAISQANHLLKMSIFAVPGLLWSWRQLRNNPSALSRIKCLAFITFVIAWHEVIAGKYWFAHLLPAYFFTALCFSLLLMPANPSAKTPEKMLGIFLAIVVASFSLYAGLNSSKYVYEKNYTYENNDIRSKKIARYLQANLRTGDKVQSLDGSGDGQGSLLLVRATPATRFIEDIPLYIQPNSSVTQQYRKEFMKAIQSKPPAFFVYIHNFWHPAGGNRLKDFKELNAFLSEKYVQAELVDGEYTIYALKRPTR